nr:hypothetical protein StreXyl84_63480 [Streptomyces sp. Xyl84]
MSIGRRNIYRLGQLRDAVLSGVSPRSPVNRSVPASLTRPGRTDQTPPGHLIGQGAKLGGGPGDNLAGAAGGQDVCVHLGVQAGQTAQGRVIGRVAPPALRCAPLHRSGR